MLNQEYSTHFDTAARWDDRWYLHCGGVCRVQPSPPDFPPDCVVYELYSWPQSLPQRQPIVVWVALPELVSFEPPLLFHELGHGVDSLASSWRQLKDSYDGCMLAIYDPSLPFGAVRWLT